MKIQWLNVRYDGPFIEFDGSSLISYIFVCRSIIKISCKYLWLFAPPLAMHIRECGRILYSRRYCLMCCAFRYFLALQMEYSDAKNCKIYSWTWKINIFNDLFIYSWPRSKITNISTNNLIYDSIQLQLEKVNWAISL